MKIFVTGGARYIVGILQQLNAGMCKLHTINA